jgi:hypothetical protein
LEAGLALAAARGTGAAVPADGDAAAFEGGGFPRADWRTISVTTGRGVSCHASHATQAIAKSISMAMVRQKKSEASLRSGTE